MRRAFLLGLLLSLCLLTSARAQTGLAIAQLSAVTEIQPDGSAQVEQRLRYSQPGHLDWEIFSNIHNLSITADGRSLPRGDWRISRSGQRSIIQSSVAAEDWRITYSSTTVLIRHNDRDQFYYKLFEESGRQLYNISAKLILPGTTADPAISGNLYAIGGVLDPNTVVEANQVTYGASSAGPKSLFTISATWSKDVLPLTPLAQLRLSILDQEFTPWLILGLLLPLISLLVLGELIWRHRRNERRVAAQLERPPSQLSPILVGVLVNKKIYPNEVVALLVDLCQRGYLVIVKRGDDYFLNPRKVADEHLLKWEREILEQLFRPGGGSVTEEKTEELSNESLFSPKVRDAFSQIYQVITDLRFFSENPHLTRVRYKLVALLFYFIGAIGLVWTAVSGSSPYFLIPLGATILISYLIIRLSPGLINYTPDGMKVREEWLAFGNFLGSNRPLGLEASQNQTFERYLPYAIALHRTAQWAKRFDKSSLALIRPDWFVSYQEASATEFVTDLVAFTKKISEDITKLRGPLVN